MARHRSLRNSSGPNGPLSRINIGSPAQLKGLFVWIDDARERHGFAAAQSSVRTCRQRRNWNALAKSNDDALNDISSLGFAAKL
jgi:hypothetical protein